jgi:hypothetical protein
MRPIWKAALLVVVSAVALAAGRLVAQSSARQPALGHPEKVLQVQAIHQPAETMAAQAIHPPAETLTARAGKPLRESDAGKVVPQERRKSEASKIWARFDSLPSDARNRETLTAHWLEANELAKALPPVEVARVTEQNAAQYRERLAGLLVAGESGVAVGDDFTTLVPSRDSRRCHELASAWFESGMRADLVAAGYTTMHCPGPNGGTWRLPH